MPVKTVYLALGSNLGDRRANLRTAVDAIAGAGISVIRQSSVYETEPQDVADQPWFLNMAIECAAQQFPFQLLAALQAIERAMGRERGPHVRSKGPRLIDIDILLYGRTVIATPRLTIPHPRMLDRRFVLEPLCEINTRLRHPVTGELLSRSLSRVRPQKLRIFAE